MSTYVTAVNWGRKLSSEEMSQLLDYIDTQTAGNGVETMHNGQFARSWTTESAANDFCTFAKTLIKNQQFPTTTAVYTVA
jgi:hypothetical protein